MSRKLLAALLGLALGLPVSECSHRVLLAVGGHPYDAAETAEELERLRDPRAAFLPEDVNAAAVQGSAAGILHPFFGSELRHDTGRVMETFRAGIPDDVYTVLVVGGSVAKAWVRPGGAQFLERVSSHPALAGKRIEFLNGAHSAHKQPQQLMRVAYLLSLGYRPDCIINIDGFNEVAFGCDNGSNSTHPVYPAYPSWAVIVQQFNDTTAESWADMVRLLGIRERAGALAARTVGRGWHHSSLIGSWSLLRMHGLNRERAQLQERLAAAAAVLPQNSVTHRQMNGPDYPRDFESLVDLSVGSWFESSLSLAALCRSRSILYIHALQPTLLDSGSKPLTEEELTFEPGTPQWRPAIEAGYPLLRERGRELLASGVAFVDASRIFEQVRKTLYFDTCHFEGRGSVILAVPIARAFLEKVGRE